MQELALAGQSHSSGVNVYSMRSVLSNNGLIKGPHTRLEEFFHSRGTQPISYIPYSPQGVKVILPSLVFIGSNMRHHFTKRIISGSYTNYQFFYVHIDAHRDWENIFDNPNPKYCAFVQNIADLESCLGVAMIGDSAEQMSGYLSEIDLKIGIQDMVFKKTNLVLVPTFEDVDKIPKSGIYLSLDLDVMPREEMKTQYSHQGTMEFAELVRILEYLSQKRSVIGADICGIPKKPTQEEMQKLEIITEILIRGLT